MVMAALLPESVTSISDRTADETSSTTRGHGSAEFHLTARARRRKHSAHPFKGFGLDRAGQKRNPGEARERDADAKRSDRRGSSIGLCPNGEPLHHGVAISDGRA